MAGFVVRDVMIHRDARYCINKIGILFKSMCVYMYIYIYIYTIYMYIHNTD